MREARNEAKSNAWWQAEAVKLAQTVVAGEIGLLEGARELAAIGTRLVHDVSLDPDFSVLVAVASETDDLPIGQVRALWDRSAVAERDREIADYEARVREVVLAACRSIRTRYAAG